jgi:hypothetical protein
MIEEWKELERLPGCYISSFGRFKGPSGEISKPQTAKYVRYCRLGKFYAAHRLVAQAFLPNPDNLPQVNHKDGDKYNNLVDNLEWCDASHNQRHAREKGLKVSLLGEEQPQSKLTETQVRWIMVWRSEGFTLKQIASVFNIHFSLVSRICKGESWPHLGGMNESLFRFRRDGQAASS